MDHRRVPGVPSTALQGASLASGITATSQAAAATLLGQQLNSQVDYYFAERGSELSGVGQKEDLFRG
jgi:hypothetical protein